MTLEAQRSLRVGNPLPSPHVPQDLKSHLFVKSYCLPCPPCAVALRHPRGPVFPFIPFQPALLTRPLLCVLLVLIAQSGTHRV